MLRKILEPLPKIAVLLRVNVVLPRQEATSVSASLRVVAEVAEPRMSSASTEPRSPQLRMPQAKMVLPMLVTIATKTIRRKVPLRRRLTPLLTKCFLHRIPRLKMVMLMIWLRTLTTTESPRPLLLSSLKLQQVLKPLTLWLRWLTSCLKSSRTP